MKKILKIFLMCIIILSLFILTGCKDNTNEMLNEKINSEMSYLENIILMIVKKYMANDYLNEEHTNLNWIDIKYDFADVNSSSNVIVTDFATRDFSNEDILKFEELLNNVNLAISEENEINLLVTLSNFYSLIPEFGEKYLGYNAEVTIRKIKNLNLYSIISCMQGDFDNAEEICNQAESEYINLTKDTDYMKENGYYVNRIYVVLQEYKMTLAEENLDLSIVKYLNTLGI